MRQNQQKKLKWSFLLVLLLFCSVKPSFAQLSGVGTLIRSGTADANTLAKAFLAPAGKGFGAGLNSGWIISPYPHKKLGFDISVRTGLVMVPSSDQTFNVNNLGLQDLKQTGGPINSPTISGPNKSGATLTIEKQVNGKTYNLGNITLPKGTGFHFVPTPMIQAGIGLFAHTQITLRYLPKTKITSKYGYVQLFGIGIQHGLNQYVPEGKLLPVKLSIMAAYTDFKAWDNLNIMPQINSNTTNPNQYPASTWAGQQAKTETKAFTINAIVGKTLPFISVYGGVGYETAKMNVSTPGNYPITAPDPTSTNPYANKINEVAHPINFSIKDPNSFRAFAGFKLQLAIFYISASYTVSKYSMANFGVGFSFR